MAAFESFSAFPSPDQRAYHSSHIIPSLLDKRPATSPRETGGAGKHVESTDERLSDEDPMRSRISRGSARPTTSSSSSRWRGGATPTGSSPLPCLWRVPGHHGDGTYSKDMPEWRRDLREEMEKRVAGNFVVSTVPSPSINLPPTFGPRPQPAHSPYYDVWRVGVPPTGGRWVLERGRPRWAPEQPGWSLSQSSADAQVCGYKDTFEEAKRSIETQEESSQCAYWPAVDSATSKDGVSFMQSDSNRRGSNADSEGSGSGANCKAAVSNLTCLARSTRTGDEAATENMVRKQAQVLNQRLRNRRKSKRHSVKAVPMIDVDAIEEMDEILKTLDSPNGDDGNDVVKPLPRFEWVPRSPSAPSTQKPRSFSFFSACAASTESAFPSADSVLPAVEEHSSHPCSPMKTHQVSAMSRDKKYSVAKRQDSVFSLFGSDRVRKSSVTSTTSTVAVRTNKYSADRRKEGRDQRSELKRLQQTLVNSGQQAFDAEVWEACGIEAEHLKRHQFAALIQSGLFKIGGPRDDADSQVTEDPASADEPTSPSPRAHDGSKTVSMGANLKTRGSQPRFVLSNFSFGPRKLSRSSKP